LTVELLQFSVRYVATINDQLSVMPAALENTMAQADTNELDVEALCVLTGFTKRTVRYYIHLGLVDKPVGETRAARYGQRHLERLLAIRRWTQAGLSLEAIRELLSEDMEQFRQRPNRAGTVEVWSHFIVAEGVEVKLDPAQAGLSSAQTRRLFAAVAEAFQNIKQQDLPE
jgi:DNA-binding transcriptional MerR regulator